MLVIAHPNKLDLFYVNLQLHNAKYGKQNVIRKFKSRNFLGIVEREKYKFLIFLSQY